MDNLLQCLVTPMSRKFFSTFTISFACYRASPSLFLSPLHTKKKLCLSFLLLFLYLLSVLPSKPKHSHLNLSAQTTILFGKWRVWPSSLSSSGFPSNGPSGWPWAFHDGLHCLLMAQQNRH